MRDENEMDPLELEASRHDLNYVKLDGDIGCMVNGAGLAMATMDIIQHYGGQPANFMDIAGAATKERVACAFKLIFSDPEVKGILGWAGEGALATKSIDDLPWHIRRDADGAWAEKPPRKVIVVPNKVINVVV